MLPHALLALAGLAAHLAGLDTSEVRMHPQDGPDADVRIWIEPSAVTFHVIVNLAFADEIVDLAREDEMNLDPAEYGLARELLFEYFRDHNHVTIDGVEVTPVDIDFEGLPPDLSLLPHFPRFGTRAMTKLRLVLEYSAKSPPKEVGMVWGPFPPDYVLEEPGYIPPLEIVGHLRASGTKTTIRFTETEPGYVWHGDSEATTARLLPVPERAPSAPLDVPVVSTLLWLFSGVALVVAAAQCGPRRRRTAVTALATLVMGFPLRGVARVELANPFAGRGALPSESEALAIFQPLHANIYRAFDYTRESDVYDALARSVHGDLLDALYNEVYASLVLQEEGGAVSEVQAVRPIETTIEKIGLLPPEDHAGFLVTSRWQVDGAVFHWGHSHWRTNEYQARYAVAATDAGWRIAESQVLEQFRVDSAPIPAGGPNERVFPAELVGKDL